MRKPRLRRTIFWNAAIDVADRNKFSCNAISRAGLQYEDLPASYVSEKERDEYYKNWYGVPERDAYREAMKSYPYKALQTFMIEDASHEVGVPVQDLRIMLLLFAMEALCS